MVYKKDNFKIIITVRLDLFHPKQLEKYSTYKDSYEKCYDLYKLYSEKNGAEVFNKEKFLVHLKSDLKIEDELGEMKSFFMEKNDTDFSYNKVFLNDNFKRWIECDGNKGKFIEYLVETDAEFLVRKHDEKEIYIFPVLNKGFDKHNIKYIETIIGTFMEEDSDELYLLLHDKDLYNGPNKHHPVSDRDELGLKLDDGSVLKTLINDNKVFVFQHIDQDKYYCEIIKKLNILSIDEIIKKLEEQAQVILFGKQISKCMRKREMESVLADEKENNKYNFSEPFLD